MENNEQIKIDSNNLKQSIETNDCSKVTASPKWSTSRSDDAVRVLVDLPGVSKENIALKVVDSRLHLNATRTKIDGILVAGHESPDEYFLELRLGRGLDISAAQARVENGVLELTLPLSEAVKPRHIEIL